MDLKSLRELRGVSQALLSQRTGIPQAYISHAETGARELGLDSVILIENELNGRVNWADGLSPVEKFQALQAVADLASRFPLITVLKFAVEALEDKRDKVPVKKLAIYAQIATRGSEGSLLPPGVE